MVRRKDRSGLFGMRYGLLCATNWFVIKISTSKRVKMARRKIRMMGLLRIFITPSWPVFCSLAATRKRNWVPFPVTPVHFDGISFEINSLYWLRSLLIGYVKRNGDSLLCSLCLWFNWVRLLFPYKETFWKLSFQKARMVVFLLIQYVIGIVCD